MNDDDDVCEEGDEEEPSKKMTGVGKKKMLKMMIKITINDNDTSNIKQTLTTKHQHRKITNHFDDYRHHITSHHITSEKNNNIIIIIIIINTYRKRPSIHPASKP